MKQPRMRRRTAIVVVFSITGLIVSGSYVVACPAKHISLCDLVAKPSKYERELVTLDVRVESDGFEHTSLFDESCPRTPLTLGNPLSSSSPRSLAQLNQAVENVYSHGANAKHLTIRATITGAFYSRTNYGPLPELRPISADNISILYGGPLFAPPPILKHHR